MPDDKEIDRCFKTLVNAVDDWSANFMDQFEKIKFETPYGMVYVTIRLHDAFSDSFDLVDRQTGKIIQQAGLPPIV